MRILKRGAVWVAESRFEEKDQLKAARFRWHDPTKGCRAGCAACAEKVWRSWWTDDVSVAAALAEHADPSCRAELDGRKGFEAASLAGSRAADAVVSIPVPAGRELLPFQRAGVAYMLARRDTLLADQPGLGKTVQAVGFVNASMDVCTVLVLCPATIRLNWVREAERWLARPFKFHIVEGREAPPSDATFVVVNYDKLAGPGAKPLLDALRARRWDVLIADECTALKNEKAQRTRAVLGGGGRCAEDKVAGLVASANHRLFLTGTPILNRPRELWPVLSVIEPQRFGNFFRFAKEFCDAKQERVPGVGMVWNFDGASNLERLQAELRTRVMCRRLKSEVLRELPEKIRQVVEIPCDVKARKAVDAESAAWAEQELRTTAARARMEAAKQAGDDDGYKAAVAELKDAARVAFTEMAKLRHATAVAKIPYLLAHLDGLFEDGREKIAFFGHHHDVLDAVKARYGDAAVALDGRTPEAERQAAVDRFQTDPACKLFVGGIRAAGMGITLTASATCVLGELDWTPAVVTQVEDRHHRVGQRDTVLVQHIVLEGSLDAKIAKVLVAKQAVADAALDDVPVV